MNGDVYSAEHYPKSLVQDVLADFEYSIKVRERFVNDANHSAALVAFYVQGAFGGTADFQHMLPYSLEESKGTEFQPWQIAAIKRVWSSRLLDGMSLSSSLAHEVAKIL